MKPPLPMLQLLEPQNSDSGRESPNMAETLMLRGELVGHAGWVTSISTPLDPNSDIILSSSRCVSLEAILSQMHMLCAIWTLGNV
jgi:hypothetical protein